MSPLPLNKTMAPPHEEEFTSFPSATHHVEEGRDDSEASAGGGMRTTGLKRSSSIPRNESWVRFVTHTQRMHELGEDMPPPIEEAECRKVKFREEDRLKVVHLVQPIDESFKEDYWLSYEDFERFEKEIQVTQFRWENHKSGKIQFDEMNNSTRGIEHKLRIEGFCPRVQFQTKNKHSKAVMHEIERQKAAGYEAIDWEKVRQASLPISEAEQKKAYEMGKADEHKAWKETEPKTVEKVSEQKKKKGLISWISRKLIK